MCQIFFYRSSSSSNIESTINIMFFLCENDWPPVSALKSIELLVSAACLARCLEWGIRVSLTWHFEWGGVRWVVLSTRSKPSSQLCALFLTMLAMSLSDGSFALRGWHGWPEVSTKWNGSTLCIVSSSCQFHPSLHFNFFCRHRKIHGVHTKRKKK